MEKTQVRQLRETFSCSICLDLLEVPVTLSCGHSYCMSCIKKHWDREDEKTIYSCPQCRETFRPRPQLKKNTILANLVEGLKKTELKPAPADHCYAGAEDVACDVCRKRKLKALKSCLVCLASYCEEHLDSHYQSPPLKKHKLVEPSKNLQENICPCHDETMKMFCRTDQQCICYLCSVDQHKDHDTVSAAAERTTKQRELDLSLGEIQQRLQGGDKYVKVLEQERNTLTLSADKAVKDTGKSFTEMMHLLQKSRSGVEEQIRSQQETEASRINDVEEKLQLEMTELKRREAELKQLSLTQDHTQFLLNCHSLSALTPSTRSSSINDRPLRRFVDVTASVAKVRGELEDILTKTQTNISLAVTQEVVLGPQSKTKTRAEFIRYSQEITLDQNTANTWLLLSEGNRKVSIMKERQSYSFHPDRFTNVCQVLSRESLTGHCYWEVEWRGRGVDVAVTYEHISRAGRSSECAFGFNDKSWALVCNQNNCVFRHNSISVKVSDSLSSRVGVHLDHRAGLLSFYRVSDTMTLLHRVQTTFTQPLYAGVCLYHYFSLPGVTAEFCKLG